MCRSQIGFRQNGKHYPIQSYWVASPEHKGFMALLFYIGGIFFIVTPAGVFIPVPTQKTHYCKIIYVLKCVATTQNQYVFIFGCVFLEYLLLPV